MTETELHKLFKKRFPKIRSHITYYAKGIEDRKQDGLLGMWEFLQRDPRCTDRYLKNGVIWRIQNGARTKSVDAPWGITMGKKKDVQLCSIDNPDSGVEHMLEHKSLPIDEVVSDKISFERFLSNCTDIEQQYVKAKLKGFNIDQLYSKLHFTDYCIKQTRKSARIKFEQAFAC